MTARELGPGPSIEETARGLGAARWTERRMFEVVGGSVPSATDRRWKLFFAEVAPHHAWRADQLAERLPRAGHVRAEVVTVAPDDATADRFRSLEGGPADEVARVVYGELAPRLLDAYRELLDGASPIADTAVIRTLRMVIDDLARDLDTAEQRLSR